MSRTNETFAEMPFRSAGGPGWLEVTLGIGLAMATLALLLTLQPAGGKPVTESAHAASGPAGGLSAPGGLVPERSHGGDAWMRQVLEQPALLEQIVMSNGFERTHERVTGVLQQGHNASLAFELEAGARYLLAGVCGRDCERLDLRLYDQDNGLLQERSNVTGSPLIMHDTPAAATVTLRVRMAACSREPCDFEVAVFRAL